MAHTRKIRGGYILRLTDQNPDKIEVGQETYFLTVDNARILNDKCYQWAWRIQGGGVEEALQMLIYIMLRWRTKHLNHNVCNLLRIAYNYWIEIRRVGGL